MFIIAHECLHVILNHGVRIQCCENKDWAGQTIDVVTNHILIDKFGFIRSEVDPSNQLCWYDTIFSYDVLKDKCFEYYYNLIPVKKSCETDDHSKMQDFSNIISKLNSGLPFESKESLNRLLDSNNSSNFESVNLSKFIDVSKIKPKKKWETIIKNWALKQIKDNEEEQWVKPNRRLSLSRSEFLIPSENELDGLAKEKIKVFFFQDTSGSCYGMRERFFKAAASLPKNKFDVKMHCFDIKVIETNFKSGKIDGGGGTLFSCIEKYIQEHIKKHKIAYPSAVICITDGHGDHIFPQLPQNWHFLLTTNFTHYIPKKSKIYNLKDFE